MNEELRAEIDKKLGELDSLFSEISIRAKIRELAEFLAGALGDDESEFLFNVLNGTKSNWSSAKSAVVARLKGRLHSSDWAVSVVPPTETLVNAVKQPTTSNNKVFIVHGHDEAARESVARFLEKLGLVPVILHEQANQSLTVIEKLERHSDVRFAVVLLTPDDLGCKAPDSQNLVERARQNVLIELGYFVGKLGRSNVCPLRVGNTEIPSDFSGVVYTDMDKAGAWRTKLAQELVSANSSLIWPR